MQNAKFKNFSKKVSGDPITAIIEAKVFLAPLSGITDVPFRLMARKYGCKFAFTEMVDVNGIFYNNQKTMNMLDWPPEDTPLGVQLVGQDLEKMQCAAKKCEEKGYGLVDLNVGCPARKVIKCGKGSALMKSPDKFASIIRMLVKELSVPVTVKMRSGWDENDISCVELAKIAESEGVAAISIHPRTQSQMFKKKPDHAITALLKRSVSIPVFASGDMFEPCDIDEVLNATGCDAVIIARGALGRPWIFEEIQEYFSGGSIKREMGLDDIKKVIMEHMAIYRRHGSKERIFFRMYKHICWYLKRYKGLQEIMKKYRKLKTYEEAEELFESLYLDDGNTLYIRGERGGGVLCVK